MEEKIKILITDDSEMNLKLFEALVKSFGYDCTTAINGQIACDLVQTENFNMILMDIEMPVLDGKETLKKIKSNQNNIMPIIALTAHKNREKLLELINFGFNDCLVKPFSKNDLKNIILKFCKKESIVSISNIPIKSSSELFNLNYLRDISDNNETLLNQLIETFIKLVPSAIENMKKYYNTGNIELLYIESHKFASQLTLIGATKTSCYAATIEKLAKEKKDINQIEQLVENIENDCTIIIEELQSKLPFK